MEHLLWLIPVLPLIGFLINGLVGKKLPTAAVSLIACLLPAASFVLAALAFVEIRAKGGQDQTVFTWIATEGISISFGLQMDELSTLMVLVVTGVGSLIHLYSVGYMKGDPGYARYFAYLNLFTFAMLVLVMGNNLPLLFVGWEGVGLCSYLLIGFWFEGGANADAGKKAFIVNRIGDFGFLLGIFTLFAVAGQFDFASLETFVAANASAVVPAGVFAGWEYGSVFTLAAICFFVGACGKSAQIPLYVWLPDAMAGPTPVSALIHAATMVTAGVYMVARMGFLYSLAPVAMAVVVVVGGVTAIFAGVIAVCQNDIKKVLAYSTVSQLGYMFMGVGSGFFFAGIFHLMTHAFFKACLFLGSGSVIHGMGGEQDVRKMGGLWRKMPITCVTFIIASLALAGLPFVTSGFFSKEAVLGGVYASAHHGLLKDFAWLGNVMVGIGFAGAGLTAFYMTRLVIKTFFGKAHWKKEHAEEHKEEEGGHGHGHGEPHESPITMTLPLILLAILSVAGGWDSFFSVGGWLNAGAAERLVHGVHDVHVLFIILSFVACGGGILLGILLYGVLAAIPVKAAQAVPPLYKLVLNKFYVDEIYEYTVVMPLRFGATVLWFLFDKMLIDTLLVHGAGNVVRGLGWVFRKAHNGTISASTAGLMIGTLLAMIYLVVKILL